ncbi:MAG TPA: bifunctional diaminohydroxyphosphoribosylaminopyrimidine deaminase/5-amino-6-(5-phosphoribosylamino)uracil reductase RibD [Treponemataceae bacterium]|nr:bifunctional diaminohydroxyphosphoribosylaminopyrimidine deaminase/5-amino-6-(5-phosphoribosylamino)uracil reductase RibD [Treponemataceae bacterium]
MRQTDECFVRHTLDLARLGTDTAPPNPLVGALIVDSAGTVLGSGWHRGPGTPHAEVHAVAAARQGGCIDFTGTTLYVNLEPCCHTGRTPPCTDLILAAGIPRIVCGMTDPDSRVSGKGVDILRNAGRTVVVGVLERECRELNAPFVTFHEKGRPYFTLKTASSLDGKTATVTGESRWITGEASRESVHRLRSRQAAILTGIGTVLADDPLLTVRLNEAGGSPLRIVADTRLRLPAESRLVQTAREFPVLAACSRAILETDEGKKNRQALEQAGVTVLPLPEKDGRVDLVELARVLAQRGIDRVLIEAGESLAWSFLESGLVDRMRMYLAPQFLGGREAPGLFRGGVQTLDRRITLEGITLFRCGEDFVLEGKPCLPD